MPLKKLATDNYRYLFEEPGRDYSFSDKIYLLQNIATLTDQRDKLINLVKWCENINTYILKDKDIKEILDHIVIRHDLIETEEFVKLIDYIPQYFTKIHTASSELLDSIFVNSFALKSHRRGGTFCDNAIDFLVRKYDLNTIIKYSIILIKNRPDFYSNMPVFIASNKDFLNEIIPFYLKMTTYTKRCTIDFMFNQSYLTDDLLYHFKNEPNTILGLMDDGYRVRLSKASLKTNDPFLFDAIKLDATICLGIIDDLNQKYPSFNEKLKFIVQKGLVLKKNFPFLKKFMPSIIEPLNAQYKSNELLGITSRKEIANNLLKSINFTLPNSDIEIL